jgi:hypothetical protein
MITRTIPLFYQLRSLIDPARQRQNRAGGHFASIVSIMQLRRRLNGPNFHAGHLPTESGFFTRAVSYKRSNSRIIA